MRKQQLDLVNQVEVSEKGGIIFAWTLLSDSVHESVVTLQGHVSTCNPYTKNNIRRKGCFCLYRKEERLRHGKSFLRALKAKAFSALNYILPLLFSTVNLLHSPLVCFSPFFATILYCRNIITALFAWRDKRQEKLTLLEDKLTMESGERMRKRMTRQRKENLCKSPFVTTVWKRVRLLISPVFSRPPDRMSIQQQLIGNWM